MHQTQLPRASRQPRIVHSTPTPSFTLMELLQVLSWLIRLRLCIPPPSRHRLLLSRPKALTTNPLLTHPLHFLQLAVLICLACIARRPTVMASVAVQPPSELPPPPEDPVDPDHICQLPPEIATPGLPEASPAHLSLWKKVKARIRVVVGLVRHLQARRTPTPPLQSSSEGVTIELLENPTPDLGIGTDVGMRETHGVAEFMASVLNSFIQLMVQPTFKRFKNRLVQQFILTLIASVLERSRRSCLPSIGLASAFASLPSIFLHPSPPSPSHREQVSSFSQFGS